MPCYFEPRAEQFVREQFRELQMALRQSLQEKDPSSWVVEAAVGAAVGAAESEDQRGIELDRRHARHDLARKVCPWGPMGLLGASAVRDGADGAPITRLPSLTRVPAAAEGREGTRAHVSHRVSHHYFCALSLASGHGDSSTDAS